MRTLLVILLLPFFACASDAPTLLKSFGKWTVYSQIDDGQKVCFMASSPISKVGNYKMRGAPQIWIRHVSKNIDEISITTGYPYKESRLPTIGIYKGRSLYNNVEKEMIDGAKSGKCNIISPTSSYIFESISNQTGWLKNVEDDEKAILEMKAGSYAVVSGVSKKNTCSLDVYSLTGFTDSYKFMKENCAGRLG